MRRPILCGRKIPRRGLRTTPFNEEMAYHRLQGRPLLRGVEAMQALTLMIVYVLTTFAVQLIGFLISRLVDYEYPTLGLMTFLVLFLGAFGIAWPIAVRIAEWLIRSRGYVVETQQSGGDARQDIVRPKARA
jgi:hypothetical protein